MSKVNPFALLVSNSDESFENLKALLRSQGIDARSSHSREDTARLLDQTSPELVFTATGLADAAWSDIVNLAENAPSPTNVIVVGKCKDTNLYLDVMDYGAFDFILPPFESEPLAHVLDIAIEDVRRRREAQLLEDVA